MSGEAAGDGKHEVAPAGMTYLRPTMSNLFFCNELMQ